MIGLSDRAQPVLRAGVACHKRNLNMAPTRVLVVEDEAIIRMVMVDALTDAGFEVDEAANSDDAERLLDEDGYKLLVTDVHMPGKLDGIELAEHFQTTKPATPILFVTARPDVLARLRKAGIDTKALTKPFSLERLISTVRGLLQNA
jgi:DNA-binding response OmpR family regulator